MSSAEALAGLFEESDDDSTQVPVVTGADAPLASSSAAQKIANDLFDDDDDDDTAAADARSAALPESSDSPLAKMTDDATPSAAAGAAAAKRPVGSSFGVTRRPRVVTAKGPAQLITTPALPATVAAAVGTPAEPSLPSYPASSSVAVVSLPSMLAIADAPFSAASWDPAALRGTLAGARADITEGIHGVIRWRRVLDPTTGRVRVESNARIIRWPDGLEQLQVGGETFTLKRDAMDPLVPAFLFAPVPATNARGGLPPPPATVPAPAAGAEPGTPAAAATFTPSAAGASVLEGTGATLTATPLLHCVALISQRVKFAPADLSVRTKLALKRAAAARTLAGRTAVHSREIYSSKEAVRRAHSLCLCAHGNVSSVCTSLSVAIPHSHVPSLPYITPLRWPN
jgi:hypothetical protein